MAEPYTGRCACGRVAVTIDAEPIATRQCWCRECQRLAGGGATHNAMFPAGAVTITGTTGFHSYVADSGNTLTQEFCPSCGTPVLGRSSGRPGLRTIRFGMLDEGHGLRPAVAIWTESAPEWALVDASAGAARASTAASAQLIPRPQLRDIHNGAVSDGVTPHAESALRINPRRSIAFQHRLNRKRRKQKKTGAAMSSTGLHLFLMAADWLPRLGQE